MIKKKYIKSRNVCRVTFEIPEAELPEGVAVKSVSVAGEFNNWDTAAAPMKRNRKGVFHAAVDLEPDREYQFRYQVNSAHWCNEWRADDYIANGLGADNCIVATTGAAEVEPPAES